MSLSDFKPGATLRKRYEILSVLGTGGMGQVVKARRLEDGVEVAIKFCFSRDPDARRRFAREVRVMTSIKHDRVVRVLKTGLKYDPPYFVMPLAEGSLSDQVADFAADEAAALTAFLEFCEGVQAIHNSGAV